MNNIEQITYGLAGTALSAVGASMSISDIQAIVSIVVTILGFILGVVLPWVINIVKKIRAAKEDGKITKEEADDIIDTIGEAGKDIADHLPKNMEGKDNE